MAFQLYRSRKVVQAKQMDHEGTLYDPRSGQRDGFDAGDWLVKDGGKEHIVYRERFDREFEPIAGD